MSQSPKKDKPDFLENFPEVFRLLKAELHQIPSAFYEEIGKIAAAWSYLEHFIDMTCWILSAPYLFPILDARVSLCLTAQIPNMGRRFDALLSLLRVHEFDEVIVKRINTFAKETSALSLERNRIIHDMWGINIGQDRPSRTEITAQKRMVFKENITDINELKKLSTKIIAKIDDFQQIAIVLKQSIDDKRKVLKKRVNKL